jgi:hypothetical protein
MKRDAPGFFVFPEWVDRLTPVLALLFLGVLPAYLVLVVWYGFSPRTTDVGYAPEQPVAYSHALHAGQLGIDCRYCHSTVEMGAHAAVPPTQTCMNCHAHIRTKSDKLLLVRQSSATGDPIPWVRVHDLPDFVYFNHSAHVRRGVGCVECHGRIDTMEVVRQVQPLSMGWCLDCHRNPEPHLRPPSLVTAMNWVPREDPEVLGRRLRETNRINPSTDCSTCHR